MFKSQKQQTQVKMESATYEDKKYNIGLLKDDSIKFLYKLRVARKLQNVSIEDNIKVSYNQIKDKTHEATFEALGYIEYHQRQSLFL